MTWTNINDDDSNVGVEFEYAESDDKFYIYVLPTNSTVDWVSNFKGRFEIIDQDNKAFHLPWLTDATFIQHWIETNASDKTISIGGWSRGGAVAQIVHHLCKNVLTSYSFDGPKPCNKSLDINSILIYRKGAIVSKIPLLWKKTGEECILENTYSKWPLKEWVVNTHTYDFDYIESILLGGMIK